MSQKSNLKDDNVLVLCRKVRYGGKVITPVPRVVPPLKVWTKSKLKPDYAWPVLDSAGAHIGYLVVFATEVRLALLVDIHRRRVWRPVSAGCLSALMNEWSLKDHPNAVIVLVPGGVPCPPVDFPGREHVMTWPVELDRQEAVYPPNAFEVTGVLDEGKGRAKPPEIEDAGRASGHTCGDISPGVQADDVPVTHPPRSDEPVAPDLPAKRLGPAPSQTILASQVQVEEVAFLWENRIALGSVTILVGPPEAGKSALDAFIAARVSSGGEWPDGSKAESGAVLFASLEDDLAATTTPRLIAAGADLDVIHFLRDPPDLIKAFHCFENTARSISRLRLILLDPFSALGGGRDPAQAAIARAVMDRLNRLAGELRCAIVIVVHPSKARGIRNLQQLAAGSVALVAVARNAHLVCRDASDPGRRLFIPFKNNLGVRAPGLAFQLAETDVPGAGRVPVVGFEGTVALTAEEAWQAADDNPEERSALDEAKAFLRDTLAMGPLEATTIMTKAAAAGISPATLNRAKRALSIKVVKRGMTGGWLWQLNPPPKVINTPEGDHAVDDHLPEA